LNDYVHKCIGAIYSETLALKAARSSAPQEELEEMDQAIALLERVNGELAEASGKHREAARKKKEWERIVPLARAAKVALLKAERGYAASHAPAVEHQNAVATAQFVLGRTMENRPKPSDYPAKEDFEAHESQVEISQAAFDQAKARARTFAEDQGKLLRELIAAKEEFRKLEWAEFHFRPRTEQRSNQIDGLSVARFG